MIVMSIWAEDLFQLTSKESKMDRITKAWNHAEARFEGISYGDFSYLKHLRDAHDVLISVGVMDKTLRIGTILHDNVEDTSDTVQDIEREFGWEIAQLVWAVSDGPGVNRKERHANTYIKTAAIKNAVIIKLADRIANLRASVGSILKRGKVDKFNMYQKEKKSFEQALLHDSVVDKRYEDIVEAMWRMHDAQYALGAEHILRLRAQEVPE